MRIVSWNCRYELSREKYEAIMEFNPDILIIQECKKPDYELVKSRWKNKNFYNDDLYTDKREYGSELGVTIFSNSFNIEFTEIFNRKYRYVIPYRLSNNEITMNLFAVWIKPDDGNYLDPLYNAVDYYKKQNMINDNTVIIGDFNTFAKDENALIKLEKKLDPLINCAKKDNQSWKLYTYYHGNNNYGTNDFCFVSADINDKVSIFIPPGWDKEKPKDYHWKGLSDHCPIIIKFNL